MRRATLILAIVLLGAPSADAHDIYTGVHGKNSQLCCGGSDCAATTYRERGGDFEFLTRENKWVAIPQERITFLPIPGDPPSDDTHRAHLCYRSASGEDMNGPWSVNVFGDIFLYCVFVDPGAT